MLGLPCAQFIWNLLEAKVESKEKKRKKEKKEEDKENIRKRGRKKKKRSKAPVACVSERIFVLAVNPILAHYLCKYPVGVR